MAVGGGTPAKKPAKRGPTKAAALKALGLTQEDLDNLKALKELRTEVNEAQREVERKDVQVSVALTPEAEEVTEGRKNFPDEWSAAAPQAVGQDATPTNTEPVFYMRNLRGVEVSFRLTRQEDTRKRTTLKPRGQRGDMQKLNPEDLKDSELRTQVAYQLIEIIPEGEALSAIDKQAYNASQPGVRPLEAMLVNSKGERPDGGMTVKTDDLPFEQQGITVARLNPQDNSPTGELPSRGRGIDWEKARNIGGNPAIISDGFADAGQQSTEAVDPRAAAVARDAVARRRGGERSGPSRGGLEGMKVTVDPVQKTD